MWLPDIALFHALNAGAQSPGWVLALARFASDILPALMVSTAFLLLVPNRGAARRTGVQLLLSMALAWCVVSLFRNHLPFPRPAELGMGIQWVAHGARPGFPSMHGTVAFAFWVCLAWGGFRIAALAVLPAVLLIGWSRICLGVHFPSDILAGALVGTLCAGLVLAGWRSAHAWRGARRLATAPAVLLPPR